MCRDTVDAGHLETQTWETLEKMFELNTVKCTYIDVAVISTRVQEGGSAELIVVCNQYSISHPLCTVN